jgi:hypothetical protein
LLGPNIHAKKFGNFNKGIFTTHCAFGRRNFPLNQLSCEGLTTRFPTSAAVIPRQEFVDCLQPWIFLNLQEMIGCRKERCESDSQASHDDGGNYHRFQTQSPLYWNA